MYIVKFNKSHLIARGYEDDGGTSPGELYKFYHLVYERFLKNYYMWPIILQFLRTNAPYITLPVAAIVGIIGYNLESMLSDRYTPYNKSVQDQRLERLEDDLLNDPTNVKKLKYQENVLGKNVSPSLQKD